MSKAKARVVVATAIPESVKALIALHHDSSPIRVRCSATAVNNLCAHLNDKEKAVMVAHIDKEIANVV